MRAKYGYFLSALLASQLCSLAQAEDTGTYEDEYVAGQIVDRDSATPSAAIQPLNFINAVPTNSPSQTKEGEEETYFSADEMINNDQLQTVTAIGNVNIMQGDMTVIADKVVYNQKDDIVTAIGNVILVEKDGNVVFSDYVELTDEMTQGTMNNVKVVMTDETRVSAKKFRQLENDNKVMDQAIYSPCTVCTGKDPLWQLKARKVKHDAASQNIIYNDAYLELKGVPILYTPYFSHPDPSVKRRSGWLFPTIGSTSYLGQMITPRYFWAIDDHQDITFSPSLTADRGILWGASINKYSEKGYLSASGTFINAEERLAYDDNSENEFGEKRNRGNLFLTGRYEINDYWVANADINYVSDRYYLKDISLPQKDNTWLTSSVQMQGFDNRNYANIAAYYYKLVTYLDLPINEEKPLVMPLMSYENVGDPNKYGAYTKNTFDFTSVLREDENSAQRFTMINSWNLPYTSPYGEKYKLVASVKSDLYYVDNYLNPNDETYSGVVGRVFPQIGLEWRLPFVKATDTSRHIIEPVIVAVAAPNGGNKEDKIPNEDSQDIEFDDTNILSLDRYAGYDRNDTGSRVSYGFNWSSYGDIMGNTSAFIAQSYYFKQNESFNRNINPDSYFSDYVGRINATPNQYLDLNYRFTLDKDSLDLTYSELTAGIGPDILRAYISYIYLQDSPNSIMQGYRERQELYTSLLMKLTQDWTLKIYNRQDLANTSRSLEHGGSIIYEDECFKLIVDLRRYNYVSSEYDDDLEYTATFVLKTLGSFGSE